MSEPVTHEDRCSEAMGLYADDEEDEGEDPDTCLNTVDGHWYVVTYGRAPYQIHAKDCSTCAEEAKA